MILNKVYISGRIAIAPQLKYLPSGSVVCNSAVAFNPDPYRDATGNLVEPPAVFVPVYRFGKPAETMAENFSVGTPVLLEGEIESDSWDDKNLGIRRSALKVSILNLQRSMVTNDNYCIILFAGNLTRDPELKTITEGRKDPLNVASASLAFNNFPYPDKNNPGKMIEKAPVFVDVAVFDRDAENLCKHKQKGDAIRFQGTFYMRKRWLKRDGQKVGDKPINELRVKADSGKVKFLSRVDSTRSPNPEAGDRSTRGDEPEARSERFAAPATTGARSRGQENLDEDVPF